MNDPVTIWKLKSGADRRFRTGHPWVYSNELLESPKGLAPGASVELQDASGKFLARGYGNPASLISFRALTRDPAESDPWGAAFLTRALRSAHRVREQAGLAAESYRLSHGEADALPGLVIDRYALAAPDRAQVFVLQAHTAGMDRLIPAIVESLEALVDSADTWSRAAVVIRNDVGVRKLEGMSEEAPRVLREAPGVLLHQARIRVGGAEFTVDLVEGQKTGFFLDQVANTRLAADRLRGFPPAGGLEGGNKLRILDLCCYVGQWSAQLARAFREAGLEVEVTAVDASAKALELARANVQAQGARCETIRGDVLKDLAGLTAESFDLVISDPPALIKGRKDLPVGKHAYLQLNTQVFRLVKRGGAVITCSCSGLLPEEEFLEAVSKAARRNGRFARWIARGSQGPDHPMLAEFPEGRYLKCWIGVNE